MSPGICYNEIPLYLRALALCEMSTMTGTHPLLLGHTLTRHCLGTPTTPEVPYRYHSYVCSVPLVICFCYCCSTHVSIAGAYMHVHTYICTYVDIYICTYVRVHVYASTYVCVHVHLYICTYVMTYLQC